MVWAYYTIAIYLSKAKKFFETAAYLEKSDLYKGGAGGYNFERLQGRRCLKNGNVPNGEKFFRQTKPI